MLAQRGSSVIERADVVDVLMTETLDRRGQRFSRNAFDRIFTRRVNVRDEKHVSVVEGTRKLLHQIVSARVTVRLKQDHDAPAAGAQLRSGQRGPDLRRMVSV